MFHFSRNIASGLALAALLVATPLFNAQGEVLNPLRGSVDANVDSAESIKLRSGHGNPRAGKEKSLLCQGCHGEFGISTEPVIPSLAGQYGDYIAKQVRDYQAGIRSHQIMNAMASTVSSQDIADIAAYFASQNKMKGPGTHDDPLGQELFLHGDKSKMRLACINCHGVNGKGMEAKISMFPVIGGQQKEYIRRQLINFRDGYRTNSPGNIMNRITNSLTDEEVEALAEYVSQQ